jgi:hypothetical protein
MKYVVAVDGFRPPGPPDSVVRTSVHCGACRAPIGAGEVYAQVADGALVRCLDCAMVITVSAWEAQGWCPWPLRLDVDAPVVTDAVDFAGRLRAASQRSMRPSHAA